MLNSNTNKKKIFIYAIIGVMIIVVLAITFFMDNTPSSDEPSEPSSSSQAVSALWENAKYLENAVFGDGKKTIDVDVVADGYSVTFTLKTDKENLADALLEHELIDGENGPYGIYIKDVNGIIADYDIDGYYWSLTQNDEPMITGASDTVISDGEHYELTRIK